MSEDSTAAQKSESFATCNVGRFNLPLLDCRELAFQNAFSQYTMTNHLEYALLSDISSIVNAINSVLFSLGEINWLLQFCLMPMPML